MTRVERLRFVSGAPFFVVGGAGVDASSSTSVSIASGGLEAMRAGMSARDGESGGCIGVERVRVGCFGGGSSVAWKRQAT